MKCQIVFPACLLLLWTLTAFVSCDGESKTEIIVKSISDGIELSCSGNKNIQRGENGESVGSLKLTYKDENTGEYTCESADENEEPTRIFVKFRTCDNCVELDTGAVVGIAVGDVLATIVIGVAVYLIASQGGAGPITSQKKSSDRQHLVPNEVSNRAPNDHYQPLKHKGGQKDMYDVLTNRR